MVSATGADVGAGDPDVGDEPAVLPRGLVDPVGVGECEPVGDWLDGAVDDGAVLAPEVGAPEVPLDGAPEPDSGSLAEPEPVRVLVSDELDGAGVTATTGTREPVCAGSGRIRK